MAQYSRIEVILKMKETGVVPVFYHADLETCRKVLKACYEGGIRIFEFTNRGDFAHEIFAELNKYALKELPGMMMGVGSVIDGATSSLYMQLGANFVVSPLLNPEMAVTCHRRKIPWVPGCGSVSEINKAYELGAEVVKVFPGKEVGGPAFIKNIKGPMPWVSIMPTGGVEPTDENLSAWFEAGAFCVGMGSKLVKKEIIKNGDFDKLKNHLADTLALVKNIREKISS